MIRRLLWVLVDGMSFGILKEAIRRGRARNLAGISAYGGTDPIAIAGLNSQTPLALALQYCDRRLEDHRISGFFTPDARTGDPAVFSASFDDRSLHERGLWAWCARRGISSTLINIPYVDGESAAACDLCRCVYQGYGRRIKRGGECDPGDIGASSLVASFTGDGYSVDSSIAASPDGIPVHLTTYRFREGTKTFSSGTYAPTWKAGDPSLESFLREYPFAGECIGRHYRKGALGATIPAGGEGTAEAAFVDNVRSVSGLYEGLCREILGKSDADVAMIYYPFLDDASHEFAGYFQDRLGISKAPWAEAMREALLDAYDVADGFVDAVARAAGGDCEVLVTSDHGMEGVEREFFVNAWLESRGALRYDGAGEIDPAASRLWYHPAGNGALFAAGAGGAACDLTALLGELASLEDPEGKRKAVRRIHEPSASGLPRIYGDYFVEPAPGYACSAAKSDVLFAPTAKTGTHTTLAEGEWIQGAFMAKGRRAPFGGIRQDEVFPAIRLYLETGRWERREAR